MEEDVPENKSETKSEVSCNLLPSHKEKKLHAMKAPRAVKRITFSPSEASSISCKLRLVKEKAQCPFEKGSTRSSNNMA